MRPGLGKPGALPLLALVVFSLLTLAPSLSSIYNIKLADFPYAGPRHVPLIQESISDPSADLLDSPRNAWNFAPSRPRTIRPPRSARLPNGPMTDPSETAVVDNKSRSSYSHESSFMFTRRARAFRTYFIQQLDDYQLLTPFANRSRSASTGSSPNITLSNATSLPTPLNNSSASTSSSDDSNISSPARGLWPPSLGAAWQQACHATTGLRGIPENAPAAIKYLIETGASHAKSVVSAFQTEVLTDAPGISNPHISEPQSIQCPCAQDDADTSLIPPSNETTDAAGRHSTELRGSCMAVVIGLIVGIAWF